MGEGTREWYGRRAIPVWDRDCGRAGRRRAGWWRLRGDNIELLGRGVSATVERSGRRSASTVWSNLCLKDLLGDCELLELGKDLSEDGVAGHGGGH